jgi:8-oxo-dGTP pyrophosphatase MutT (NUDIX family)
VTVEREKARVTVNCDFELLCIHLQQALANPSLLPSRQAVRAAYGPTLSYGRHFGPPAPSARQAAVVVLLEPRGGEWTIPLTVRPDHLPDHPGQVSLPGGRLEAGESHQQAAEREFFEELGCELQPGQILGELLPLYVYHSDYYVRSFIAISQRLFDYRPCTREVARLIHLPLAALAEPQPAVAQQFSRGLASWTAPTITGGGATIWGATAIILAELTALLQGSPP